MSGPGGPGMEQGRRLLVWFEGNYKKLAAALGGGLWCLPTPYCALLLPRPMPTAAVTVTLPPSDPCYFHLLSTGMWLLAAGAAAFKASSGAQPRPDALPAGQHQQAPSTDQLAALLQQQEAAAREQMRREARWEQEERQERDIRRDEASD